MTRTGLSRSPESSDGVPSFDTTTQKLFTTPYNTGCENYADRFIEISASGIILLIVLAACGLLPEQKTEQEQADQNELINTRNTKNTCLQPLQISITRQKNT